MTENQFRDVVAQAKADLEAQGVSLAGACGAWRITNLVAWRLTPQFALLMKGGGNRAVPQPDGTCLDGDQSRLPVGYATDYLIDTHAGYVGYDILGDGGGANGPQWRGPEDAADMVARNRQNARPALDPASYYQAPPLDPPVPVVVPPVVPVPAPTTVVDVAALAFQLARLVEQVELLHTVVEHVALVQARGLSGGLFGYTLTLTPVLPPVTK